MFERHEAGESAILVHIHLAEESEHDVVSEFHELVVSAGVQPLALITGSRQQPNPKYFIGSGKLDEVISAKEAEHADVVLFNHILSPSQQRNLEYALKCRVIDRTGLILDIFAQRARTHEGKLQVELAQLDYMSTRLIRGWTHLERQKGGIGMRGPGETQLETDRRLLRARMKSIQSRLEKVRRQREQGRRGRTRSETPTVSLVGYTNAGKSTLFNALTDAEVYSADQLFATLDPTMRRIDISPLGPVVLADTVGFIRDLPHKLVEAFRATLEETTNASLLLHVTDGHDEARFEHIEQVRAVLEEIGADEVPVLSIYNKIDLLEDAQSRIDRDEHGKPIRVWVSAHTGEGLDAVKQAIAERLADEVVQKDFNIGSSDGKLRAVLYESGGVLKEDFLEDGQSILTCSLPAAKMNHILKHYSSPL